VTSVTRGRDAFRNWQVRSAEVCISQAEQSGRKLWQIVAKALKKERSDVKFIGAEAAALVAAGEWGETAGP
jgi:hypothetical protein